MTTPIFDLQLFENTNVQTTESPGLSAEMKTFWDTFILHEAQARLFYNQFGREEDLPQNQGKKIEFRKMRRLPKATTPIIGANTPDGGSVYVDAVDATVSLYGYYVALEQMLTLTSADKLGMEVASELAYQAALTLDTITREELMGGSNVIYAPTVSGGAKTPITNRKDITANNTLTADLLVKAKTLLSSNNARPEEGNAFVAVIHPYAAEDIKLDNELFIDVVKYTSSVERIFNGEIGKYAGIRIIESTEAKIIPPAQIIKGVSRFKAGVSGAAKNSDALTIAEAVTAEEAATLPAEGVEVYINGLQNKVVGITAGTAGNAVLYVENPFNFAVPAGAVVCGGGAGKDGSAVFATVVLGKDAYAKTKLTGGGLQFIAKSADQAGGPLSLYGTTGWKATWVAKRLNEEYMVRIESGNGYSAIVEGN